MNTPIYSMRPRSHSAIPNVIFVLLVANGIVFALQQLSPRFLIINFGLWPAGVSGSPFMQWQLITYGFLHGNAKQRLILVQLVLRVVIDPRPPPLRPVFICPNCQSPMRIMAFVRSSWRPG